MTAAQPSHTRYIWAAVCGVLAFALSKALLHHGFWLALVIGVVVAVIVLLLGIVFGADSSDGFAGATPAHVPPAHVPPAGDQPAGAASPAPEPMLTPASPVAVTDPVLPPAAAAAGPAAAAPPAASAEPVAEPPVSPAVVPAAKAKAPARAKSPAGAGDPAARAPHTPKAITHDGPVRLAAPRGGAADDLKEIEGIGPAIESLLNGLGIWHFDQIAAWTEQDIAWVDGHMARFRGRIARDRWVAQARIIGAEGLAAFRDRAKSNDY